MANIEHLVQRFMGAALSFFIIPKRCFIPEPVRKSHIGHICRNTLGAGAGFRGEITSTGNGNDAVDKINEETPDLLVLDQMLPGRSGFLVMEKKANGRCQNVTFLEKSHWHKND